MPFLRKLGSQLLILHGSRRTGTRSVSQRTLFAIRSRQEALAIAGADQEAARRFQSLMEYAYPTVRFSWPALQAGIKTHAKGLPDAYEYRQERILGRFRTDLVGFARQLALTDPQDLMSHADAIRSHRAELEYVRDLIDWRLKVCEGREENQFNSDDEFFWRSSLKGDDLPPETLESFAGVMEEFPAAKSLAVGQMLLEAFPGWMAGHQYLGDICAEDGKLGDAERHFQECLEASQPRLMRERGKLQWRYDCNRPYIRSLRGLCAVLQRAGRYEEVLTTCARLIKEGDDVQNASTFRSVAFLCREQWMLAVDAAAGLREVDPVMSFVHAFAMAEQGNAQEAGISTVHAVLNHPRVAGMLLSQRLTEPKSRTAVSDHNAGVWLHRMILPYLSAHRAGLQLLKRVRQQPEVIAALQTIQESEKMWEAGDAKALAAVDAARTLDCARKMFEQIEASKHGTLPAQINAKGRAEA